MAWVTEFDLNGKPVVIYIARPAVPSDPDMVEYSDPQTGTTKSFNAGILTWREFSGSCPDGAALARVVGDWAVTHV